MRSIRVRDRAMLGEGLRQGGREIKSGEVATVCDHPTSHSTSLE